MQVTFTLDPSDLDEVHAAREALDRLAADTAPTADAAPAPAKATGGKAAGRKKDAEVETPTQPTEPEPPAEPTYTLEQVRDALKSYAALEGKDAAIAILKKHGAAAISELDEGKYEAAMRDAGAFDE